MTPYEVPLLPTPQTFGLTLRDRDYLFTLGWCSAAACWLMDIADSAGTPLVQGIPLVTGTDLLSQYEYLGIGVALIVQSDTDLHAVPDFSGLGVTGHLYVVTE